MDNKKAEEPGPSAFASLPQGVERYVPGEELSSSSHFPYSPHHLHCLIANWGSLPMAVGSAWGTGTTALHQWFGIKPLRAWSLRMKAEFLLCLLGYQQMFDMRLKLPKSWKDLVNTFKKISRELFFLDGVTFTQWRMWSLRLSWEYVSSILGTRPHFINLVKEMKIVSRCCRSSWLAGFESKRL